MIYFILVSTVVVLTLLFIFITHRSNAEKGKELAYSWGVGISATFCGVFLATYLGAIQAEKEERKTTISLIMHAAKELEDIQKRTELFHMGLVNPQLAETGDLLNQNPVEYPTLIRLVIESEGFSKYAPVAAGPILLQEINMAKTHEWVNDSKRSPRDRAGLIEPYTDELAHMRVLFIASAGVIDGEISEEEFEEINTDFATKKVFGK